MEGRSDQGIFFYEEDVRDTSFQNFSLRPEPDGIDRSPTSCPIPGKDIFQIVQRLMTGEEMGRVFSILGLK